MPSTPPGLSAACMAASASRSQPNIIQLCRLRKVSTRSAVPAGRDLVLAGGAASVVTVTLP